MKKPNVQLKNVKTFRGMEGIGINADLYINGVKCLFVIDDANGGGMTYEENIRHKDPELVKANIKLMDNYIATLPEQSPSTVTKPFPLKLTGIFLSIIFLLKWKTRRTKRKWKNLCKLVF